MLLGMLVHDVYIVTSWVKALKGVQVYAGSAPDGFTGDSDSTISTIKSLIEPPVGMAVLKGGCKRL